MLFAMLGLSAWANMAKLDQIGQVGRHFLVFCLLGQAPLTNLDQIGPGDFFFFWGGGGNPNLKEMFRKKTAYDLFPLSFSLGDPLLQRSIMNMEEANIYIYICTYHIIYIYIYKHIHKDDRFLRSRTTKFAYAKFGGFFEGMTSQSLPEERFKKLILFFTWKYRPLKVTQNPGFKIGMHR